MLSVLTPQLTHAYGTVQLQADPLVAGLTISSWKSTLKAVTMMGSNDLDISEEYLLGLSCQGYN